ncbi:hypothetical protein CL689_00130 [Candidatus Saccharibacteria bacterium]|nr:hypothetical protein [Candidatus Saccharibacteria bacterium]MBJ58954.1 hypothetical protein [Candidatus Saccharibacteria bacterium]MBQ68458.1 hypothetical protein [Candidatus Saccharibacteria bacterium]|tara:strand:- start:305 stop:544 length:240 start_codon:yes stop_codon:yes gene_type:complete
MSDSNDFKDLNLAGSEEAIQAALGYLKQKYPNEADREHAISLLQHMEAVSKGIAKKDSGPQWTQEDDELIKTILPIINR